MLIVVTDILTCPRCGPEFGLVVLADRLEERRVIEGRLGCANCREMYEIRGGLADLRYSSGTQPLPPASAGPQAGGADPEEEALRLAALIGVTGGPGVLLVAGAQAHLAGAIVALVPEIGAVAVGAETAGLSDHPGTSRVLCEQRLPLRSRSVRGVALTGDAGDALLEEGIRVLAPGGRIVLDPAPPDAQQRLERAGFAVLLSQDEVVVASGSPDR
jgi:uncharacterized protein YbaR (Trm112 family)